MTVTSFLSFFYNSFFSLLLKFRNRLWMCSISLAITLHIPCSAVRLWCLVGCRVVVIYIHPKKLEFCLRVALSAPMIMIFLNNFESRSAFFFYNFLLHTSPTCRWATLSRTRQIACVIKLHLSISYTRKCDNNVRRSWWLCSGYPEMMWNERHSATIHKSQ